MRTLLLLKSVPRIAVILLGVYLVLLVFIYFRQRSLLYFPSHASPATSLAPWRDGERLIGWRREAPNPQTIWLMLHGNAGQAAHRDYVLRRLSEPDSLYVMEYPGYGSRAGRPSRESINQAAAEAYQLLRARNPHTPVCVLGESIGSGPASELARETIPPDKIILLVPFDSLAKVAAWHFPWLPVRYLLHDAWDNVEALRHYAGPVDIVAATGDTVIPISHARALAAQLPKARFIPFPGGHNDWSESDAVKIER